MIGKLEALRYLLSKASIETDLLKMYIDDSLTLGLKDHATLKTMIELARDIVEEAILP
jgi:hypothetical protein